MASEILAVPEDNLQEVIEVIRAGMKAIRDTPSENCEVSDETFEQLTKWCDAEEKYLNG